MTDVAIGTHGLETAEKGLGRHFDLWLGIRKDIKK
jgi:hypothetical protein